MGWKDAPVVAPAATAPAAGGKWQDAPVVATAGGFKESFVGQGLSGFNEGVANILGTPVDLANQYLIRPAMAGINAVAGTNFQPSEKPFLGKGMMRDLMAPTIFPETADPLKQGLRQTMESVGETMVPGAGLAGKAAKPIATLLAEFASGIGSGAGGVVADNVAPGNPWVKTALSLGGGLSPMTAGALLRRSAAKAAAPTAEALEASKQAAYQQADSLGVKYSQQGYDDMVTAVKQAAVKDHISPTRHSAAFSFIEDMAKRGRDGMSLTELDQLRQEVRRDLLRNKDEAEQHFGRIVLDEIDDFIAKAGGSQIAAGSGIDANQAILRARELNTRWRKTELIEDALYAAELKAASTGSGGNLNNSLRTALRGILLNPKQRGAFSADELSEMETVVKQGKGEDLLRLVGKLSPSGNGLMAALGIGGTVANPAMAVFPLAGMAAKKMADSGTVRKALELRAKVARGGEGASAPFYSGDDSLVAQSVLAGQAANQNQPTAVSQALLRRMALN